VVDRPPEPPSRANDPCFVTLRLVHVAESFIARTTNREEFGTMELWEQPVDVRIASAQAHVQQKLAQLAQRFGLLNR